MLLELAPPPVLAVKLALVPTIMGAEAVPIPPLPDPKVTDVLLPVKLDPEGSVMAPVPPVCKLAEPLLVIVMLPLIVMLPALETE